MVLAVAAYESSGASALVQAGLRVLTSPSVLNTNMEEMNLKKQLTKHCKYFSWKEMTDLAWVVFAGGTGCDASRAAVKVFENNFITLDNQLADAACTAATSSKNFRFSLSLPLV